MLCPRFRKLHSKRDDSLQQRKWLGFTQWGVLLSVTDWSTCVSLQFVFALKSFFLKPRLAKHKKRMDATIWLASLFTKWIILDHLWRDAQHISGLSQTSLTLFKHRSINSALLGNKASSLKEWLFQILFCFVAWQPTCAVVGKHWQLNELMLNKHTKGLPFYEKKQYNILSPWKWLKS